MNSVFWKVAGVLIGAQVITGLLAVLLTSYFATQQRLPLIENTIRQQLDNVAFELELALENQQVYHLDSLVFQPDVIANLKTRFPDPLFLVDANGKIFKPLHPQKSAYPKLSPQILERFIEGKSDVFLDKGSLESKVSYAAAPVFSDNGILLAGGLVVLPLQKTIQRELQDVNKPYKTALWTVTLLSLLLALVIGGFMTWRMVQPLREITNKVEEIGGGNYSTRIYRKSKDELFRLADAVNQMAEKTGESIQSLKETDLLRKELLANLGHDLRTPLAATLGYLEEAERYAHQNEQQKSLQNLQAAAKQGDYLKRLLNDMFELSILDSGTYKLNLESVPIGELLNESYYRHVQRYEKSGIILNLELEKNLPIVRIDALRILRVIDNLLSNARRYSPVGSQVILKAVQLGKYIEIKIIDNGNGISEAEMKHIFERYYRGTDARTRNEKGTGLGLAIAKASVEAHGGTLGVESKIGQGSIFTLNLKMD